MFPAKFAWAFWCFKSGEVLDDDEEEGNKDGDSSVYTVIQLYAVHAK